MYRYIKRRDHIIVMERRFSHVKTMKLFFGLLLVVALSAQGFADSDSASHDVTLQVNEIALIDLNDASAITLTTNAPAAGGAGVLGDSDSSKLLQYTSLVASTVTRRITVNLSGSAVPAGTLLYLEATSVPANCGTAGGQLTLSTTAANLISGIGSCATGVGANGAALTYTFHIDDVNQLVVGSTSSITVNFTLTDN